MVPELEGREYYTSEHNENRKECNMKVIVLRKNDNKYNADRINTDNVFRGLTMRSKVMVEFFRAWRMSHFEEK